MIKNISKIEFVQAFDDYNRSDNFTVEAREALYEYFEEIDSEMELDVIAICCDLTEYADIDEYNEDCGIEYEDIRDVDDVVVECSGGSFVVYTQAVC